MTQTYFGRQNFHYIDEWHLLILWNLLKTKRQSMFPAYRLARYFFSGNLLFVILHDVRCADLGAIGVVAKLS